MPSFITVAPYIAGIILIVITLYIIIYIIYPSSGSNDMLPILTPLNKKIDVVHSDITKSKILGSSGSTVMGFFKLQMGDRTNTTNIFTPLLFVNNNWYLEISSVKVNDISARLRVITTKPPPPDSKTGIPIISDEIIKLPSIPKQKWIFIAILRDGRRFDIIYDNKIVESHRIKNYPVAMSMPLSIGDKKLDGSAIHIIVNGTRLSPDDVERERVRHVDTNNMVLEDNSITNSLPGLNLFAQCPPGLPCNPITKPPQNKSYKWNTPYN